jgi:hypothetical protein
VDGAAGAIEFYTNAFDAADRLRQGGPDGSVWHAELAIDDSVIIVADQMPGQPGMLGPKAIGGTPAGDDRGSFGHLWGLATHVEDVPPRRSNAGQQQLREDAGA